MDSARFQRGRGTARGQRAQQPQQPGAQPATQRRGGGPQPEPEQPPPRAEQPRPEPGFRGRGDARPGGPSAQLSHMSIGDENGGAARGAEPSRGTSRQRPINLVTRPPDLSTKQGTAGQAAMITANYFRIEERPEWALYQYRVDFEPDEDRTQVRKALLRPHKEMLGPNMFDGTVLFTTTKLPVPCEVMSEKREGTQVKIIIKLTTDVRKSDSQYTQFMNLILRKCLGHLDLQIVGRDFFDAHNKVVIREHNLEVWPGYLTSIKQAENELLLNVDISHKVMRNETALELFNTCAQRERNGAMEEIFRNAIIGTTVITRYNNRTYRVDDVDFRSSPMSTFDKKGTPVTYCAYYKEKYQLEIRDQKQPLLVSIPRARDVRAGQDQPIVLVPELCCLTGITDAMRNNFQLMTAMGEHTRVRPANRVEKLERGFVGKMRNSQEVQNVLREWGLRFSDKLVQFKGRFLANEKVYFGNSGNHPQATDRNADFTTMFRSATMLKAAPIKSWVVIYPQGRMAQDVNSFIGTLMRSASSFQYRIPDPRFEEIRDDRPGTYAMSIEQSFNQYNPSLIMCIVPNQRSDRYEAIKKKCYVDRSIPNQVVLAKNLRAKGVMSICTKIAIQLNCKLGGAPWRVHVPFADPTMIAGFDVCHDSRSKGKSFGALICSLDNVYSRYYSAVSAHTSGEELSNDLSIQFIKAVDRFKKNNGKLPVRIIFYRDGVGDGNIPYVLEHEVKVIEERLKEMNGGNPIPMTVVVVSKRINTRLFVNNDNPVPGTIADDVITSPERFDFFLVSQSVRQGTVSPTSYNVIYNSAKLNPDVIQQLSYKLTHMYYNWSGTVRVPAQCQYAHKLAFLVSQYIHRAPNTGMEDLLYFL